jgi:hypothetical protein
MCTCIYCVLYCLYCVFVLFRLCIFILLCFFCTSVRMLPPSDNSSVVIIIIIIIIMFPLRWRLHPSASPAVHHVAVILPFDAICYKMLAVPSQQTVCYKMLAVPSQQTVCYKMLAVPSQQTICYKMLAVPSQQTVHYQIIFSVRIVKEITFMIIISVFLFASLMWLLQSIILHHYWFLGAFATFRNLLLPPLCLSVRMEQLHSPWTDFNETWHEKIIRKSVVTLQI